MPALQKTHKMPDNYYNQKISFRAARLKLPADFSRGLEP
jgi:hypothetical protein